MTNATLNYVIKIGNEVRRLNLYSEALYFIDRHTADFKDEKDFISHYYDKERIENFIRENGNIEGNLSITYAINVNQRKELPLLYNMKEDFIYKDDPYKGQITEIEKARKLLFNSKQQLFVKIVLSSKILEKFLNTLIDLPYKTENLVYKYGLKTVVYKDKHYIKFRDLFTYRIKSRKLGPLREVYEYMLFEIKKEIMNSNDSDYYYYNRQFKLLIDEYNEHMKDLTVKHLKIFRRIPENYKIVRIYR